MEELAAVGGLVDSANLPAENKQRALWCLGRLKPLYEKFSATYESRFRTEIIRLEQALFESFAKSPDQLSGEVHERVQALHTRLGFEGVKAAR